MIYGYKKKTKPANWTTTPKEVERRAEEMRIVPVPSLTHKPVKRPRRQSKTARKASAGYSLRAAMFVAAANQLGETCPVVALVPKLQDDHTPASIEEVHHPYGRGHGGRGPLLMDERLWIGMSSLGHRHVHDHPAWARANGFLAPVGCYNTPVPKDALVERLDNGGIRVERNLKKEVDGHA